MCLIWVHAGRHPPRLHLKYCDTLALMLDFTPWLDLADGKAFWCPKVKWLSDSVMRSRFQKLQAPTIFTASLDTERGRRERRHGGRGRKRGVLCPACHLPAVCRFFRTINLIMSHQLRSLMMTSLQNYVKFIKAFDVQEAGVHSPSPDRRCARPCNCHPPSVDWHPPSLVIIKRWKQKHTMQTIPERLLTLSK